MASNIDRSSPAMESGRGSIVAVVSLLRCTAILVNRFSAIHNWLQVVIGCALNEYHRLLSTVSRVDQSVESWVCKGSWIASSTLGFVYLKMLVDQLCMSLQKITTIEDAATQKSEDVCDLHLSDLQVVDTIGLGGFGRVQLVRHRRDEHVYALKVMNKKHIVKTKQEQHVLAERDILLSCRNPFIVKLHRTFRDSHRIYMLMECCIGGELYTLIRDRGRLDVPTAQYYGAAAVEALSYLHRRSIVYRDLKPENMLIQRDGTPKLVDFGFAKHLEGESERTYTFCGTAEYIAPEIVLNKGHDTGVDIWALGIFLYELLTGSPPFSKTDARSTYNSILRGIESVFFPHYLSNDSVSLITNLCRREPNRRLGYGRMENACDDPWFNLFDFHAFRNLNMQAPFIPTIRGDADTRNFDHYPVIDRFATGIDESGWDSEF